MAIIARHDVPDEDFPLRTLFVYASEGRNGTPVCYIDMGTNFHRPNGGLTIGGLDRMILLRDSITRVIEEVQGRKR